MASQRRLAGSLRLDFSFVFMDTVLVHACADPTWNLQRTNMATFDSTREKYWYRSYCVSRIQYYTDSTGGAVVTTFASERKHLLLYK
jgi:hypothetical protein